MKRVYETEYVDLLGPQPKIKFRIEIEYDEDMKLDPLDLLPMLGTRLTRLAGGEWPITEIREARDHPPGSIIKTADPRKYLMSNPYGAKIPPRSVPPQWLIDQARKLMVGQPKVIRGVCDDRYCNQGRSIRCSEIHMLGGVGAAAFSDHAAIAWKTGFVPENAHGTLTAMWDIHAKRYAHVYAYFARVHARPDVYLLDDILEPEKVAEQTLG